MNLKLDQDHAALATSTYSNAKPVSAKELMDNIKNFMAAQKKWKVAEIHFSRNLFTSTKSSEWNGIEIKENQWMADNFAMVLNPEGDMIGFLQNNEFRWLREPLPLTIKHDQAYRVENECPWPQFECQSKINPLRRISDISSS